MKEKIKQLAKGKVEYLQPTLVISVEKISFEVGYGQQYKGKFIVSNDQEMFMKGVLYSSDSRMRLITKTFAEKVAVIEYEYMAQNEYEENEIVSGTITIVSSCGEYNLAFQVKLVPPCLECNGTEVYDLFGFASEARKNWIEAGQSFVSEAFVEILLKGHNEEKELYQTLLKGKNHNIALEEFLICMGLKDKIILSFEEEKKVIVDMQDEKKETIVIHKNQWGYAKYHCYATEKFISLEKTEFDTFDFEGQNLELNFQIKTEKLLSKTATAYIVIEGSGQRKEIKINIQRISSQLDEHKERKEQIARKQKFDFVKSYILFRIGNATQKEYADTVKTIIDCNEEEEKKEIIDLLRIHYEMIRGNTQKVEGYFQEYEERQANRTTSMEAYLGYLYLKAMFTKKNEEIQFAVGRIKEEYRKNKDHFILLWYLIYLDEELQELPEKKLGELEKQYRRGVHSPVLYYEAFLVFYQNSELLREFTKFNIQVLHWCVKTGCITKEMEEQYIFLAGRLKGYKEIVFRDMEMLYERKEREEILACICRLLILGDKDQKQYFKWYKRAVISKLKITELYEYYMMSYDEESEEEIEEEIIRYFMHNSSLSKRKKANIYSYLLMNKEKYNELYKEYFNEIVLFGKEQLLKKMISKSLAVIYKELVSYGNYNEEIVNALSEVMFSYEVTCTLPYMKGVMVEHQELANIQYTPFEQGKAIITLYTKSAKIYLVDLEDNIYISVHGEGIYRYMDSCQYRQICLENNVNNIPFYLNYLEFLRENNCTGEDIVAIYNQLITSELISDEYKEKMYLAILDYYLEQGSLEELEEQFEQMNLELLDEQHRVVIIEYYIMRDLFENALEAINQYGFRKIELKRLLKLCTKVIQLGIAITNQEVFLEMCYYIYEKQKATRLIMRCLMEYYEGTTNELYQIWKDSTEAKIDCYELEERLLGQILFTETMLKESFPVFISYYNKAKRDWEHLLTRAYLTYSSFKFLMNDRVLPEDFFKILEHETHSNINDACNLALLKYYSTKDQIEESIMKRLDYLLHQYVNNGITLSFFQNYKNKFSLPYDLEDKYFVEYQTNPNNRVKIHYLIGSSNINDAMDNEYRCVAMKNMFGGIFVQSFSLFYNDTLQYYISEEADGEEKITESYHIVMDHTIDEVRNKFDFLNLMLIALDMKDDKTEHELMKQYVINEQITNSLFRTL